MAMFYGVNKEVLPLKVGAYTIFIPDSSGPCRVTK